MRIPKKSSTFAPEFRNFIVLIFILADEKPTKYFEIGERRHKSPNDDGVVSKCDFIAEREGEMGEWLKPTVC